MAMAAGINFFATIIAPCPIESAPLLRPAGFNQQILAEKRLGNETTWHRTERSHGSAENAEKAGLNRRDRRGSYHIRRA
ncbi:MAG: hypothetical protein ABIO86_15300 [Sphingomonas sp.]